MVPRGQELVRVNARCYNNRGQWLATLVLQINRVIRARNKRWPDGPGPPKDWFWPPLVGPIGPVTFVATTGACNVRLFFI